jgi:signal transduction histidine kinase/ActR/RegA family two-component response regulator
MGIGLDLVGRRRDGSELPVEISLTPIETSDGPVVVAFIIDITARKVLENELLQAQKMESLGRLVGGIAHDFNNMLSVIGGNAELLLSDLEANGSADELRHSALEIKSAAERAATLTGQLLAFGRQQVVRPQVLDLDLCVRELEPMLRRLIGENIDLVLVLAAGRCPLRADRGQLDQILVNLVVNARDAIGERGTITVETTSVRCDEAFAPRHVELTPGAYVRLSVGDDGAGMSRTVREHAFEPFFTTKAQGKGTGLGLATVYGIVRQAGGHVRVDSEPGHGTTFELYFPAVEAAAGEAAGEEAADGEPVLAVRGAAQVLVVEDEGAVRDLTTRVLERARFEVTVVADGEAALAALADPDGGFDVVVSDVVMPGVSGAQLADWLFTNRPGVGVVLLSGYVAESLDVAGALARGARFVAKPFTPTALLAAVATALAETENARRTFGT